MSKILTYPIKAIEIALGEVLARALNGVKNVSIESWMWFIELVKCTWLPTPKVIVGLTLGWTLCSLMVKYVGPKAYVSGEG
jgi:hypothetical protein